MKTPMQELIEDLQSYSKASYNIEQTKKYAKIIEATNNGIIKNIEKYFLEKEKKAIIDAWEKGFETHTGAGNIYYNETY